MKGAKASRTAQYMALFRALETKRPAGERIFTDPYAIGFLDRRLRLVTKISGVPLFRRMIEKKIAKMIPGALSSGIARTKYIDDLLAQTIHQGSKQVIILGAGFDTRALRLDFLQSIPVIEIDHPNTAALKLATLENKFNQMPAHIKYLQVDFNKESLEDLIKKQPIDFSLHSTIIWEGVTNYLSVHAISNTFKFIEKFAQGSFVIFTYVDKKVLEEPESFFGAEKLLSDLDELEERWTFGFDPGSLPDYLRQFHLILIEDNGASAYREKYLPRRNEKGYEFYRVAFAGK